jgi:hypothetical protein
MHTVEEKIILILEIALGIVLAVVILANLGTILALSGTVVLVGIGLAALAAGAYFAIYVANEPNGFLVPLMMVLYGVPLGIFYWWREKRDKKVKERNDRQMAEFEKLTPRLKQDELERRSKADI